MVDMKKRLFLLVMFCGIIVVLPCLLRAEKGSPPSALGQQMNKSSEAPTSQDQPQASFESVSYSAGEVWEGETVSHDFIVKNTGTAELAISSVRAG